MKQHRALDGETPRLPAFLQGTAQEPSCTAHPQLPTLRPPAPAAAPPGAPFCIGFAAESHNVLEHARAKRLKKSIPMLVANEVSIAMGSSRNQVTIIDAYGDTPLPEMSKHDTAAAIVQHLSTLLHQA